MSYLRRNLTPAEKKRIAASGGWTCAICKRVLPASFQIDHVVPLSEGGEDHADNMQSLCPNCHADKTQREAIERGRRGRRRQKFLFCSVCEKKLSPYFSHSC